jgi:hypothetical protein
LNRHCEERSDEAIHLAEIDELEQFPINLYHIRKRRRNSRLVWG